MNYQILEDIESGRPNIRLTRSQIDFIRSIGRPQLQEDVYEAMTGRSTMPSFSRKGAPKGYVD